MSLRSIFQTNSLLNPVPFGFSITLGIDAEKLSQEKPVISAQFNSFCGYCYHCDYAQHSQNYCPLKKCHICQQYGHSYKVCPQEKTQENWRNRSCNSPKKRTFRTWKCAALKWKK